MQGFCLPPSPHLSSSDNSLVFTSITYGFFYNFQPLTEVLHYPFPFNNEWTHLKLQVFALMSSSRQKIQET